MAEKTREELAAEREALWQRALEIAGRHPGMDPLGVYNVLRNLQRPVEERLRRLLRPRRPLRDRIAEKLRG